MELCTLDLHNDLIVSFTKRNTEGRFRYTRKDYHNKYRHPTLLPRVCSTDVGYSVKKKKKNQPHQSVIMSSQTSARPFLLLHFKSPEVKVPTPHFKHPL